METHPVLVCPELIITHGDPATQRFQVPEGPLEKQEGDLDIPWGWVGT